MSDTGQPAPQQEPPYQHPPYPGEEGWPHRDPGDEDDDDLPRRWRADDAVLNIVGILREVYDDGEAFAWLIMPHNELHDATPLDLIATGRAATVASLLRRLRNSVHL